MKIEHNLKDLVGDELSSHIMTFIFHGLENGSGYSGMSYEDGMMALVDLLEGNTEPADFAQEHEIAD